MIMRKDKRLDDNHDVDYKNNDDHDDHDGHDDDDDEERPVLGQEERGLGIELSKLGRGTQTWVSNILYLLLSCSAHKILGSKQHKSRRIRFCIKTAYIEYGSIPDICHNRHNRRWCTFFKPVYLFPERTWKGLL